MKKHYFLNVLMLVVLAMMLPQRMNAQISVWDGTSTIWTQGSGTEANPYLIQNARQLAYIAERVNSGATHYENTYFKLTTNVRIDSTTAWNPIGLNETNYFSGHFDGDNHTITLYLHSSLAHVGLFGCAQNASIKNLNIAGEIMQHGTAAGSVGGVVSRCLGNTTVSNCHNSGAIESVYSTAGTSTHSYNYSRVGGIVGYCSAGTSILNCSNTGDISSHAKCTTTTYYNYAMFYIYIGGIVGCSNDGVSMHYSNRAKILNCYNTGNISSSTLNNYTYYITYTGGIVGYSIRVNISDCYNTGVVSSTSATSHFSAFLPSTGGIAGENHSASYISDCYNTGNIISFGHGNSQAGGIIGDCMYDYTVTNCYNTGEVSSSTYYTCNYCCAGGIIGKKEMGSNEDVCTISNCYNTGNISSTAPQSSSYSGGILGYGSSSNPNALYTPTMSNCYNVGSVSGINYGGIQGNISGNVTNCHYLYTCGGTVNVGIEQTEYVMKSSTFPGILNTDSVSFVKDIIPNINQGYPIFGKVHTLDADNISYTTATLHGDYRLRYAVGTHGFEYKKASESNYITVITSGDSPVSQTLANLQSGTQYTYRFFVQKDGVYYRGTDKTFSTMQCTLAAQIVPGSNTFCAGDTMLYTATATSSASTNYSYIWNTGNQTSSISVTDGATYTVTITDDHGCSATANYSMTVNPLPEVSVTGITSICEGDYATLTAAGAHSYHWSNGYNTTTINVSTAGNYTVVGTSAAGCSSTFSVNVSVTPLPVITIMGETDFCAGDSTSLTATGGDLYSWSTGVTSATIHVSTAGSYRVTASTSNGCTSSASVTVSQNQPTPVFITGDTIICAETGSELTVTPGASYSWSSGDTSQTLYVTNPGVYSVTVTDNNGCLSYATKTVSDMEQVTISGNTTICSGQSTILSATGEGSFVWSNGENGSFVTVTDPGTYTITASMLNGCISSDSVVVIVNPRPSPSIIGDDTICQGQTATLTATGGVSYIWSNGSTDTSIVVSQSGRYFVTLTNIEGCTASANVEVTVNPLPDVTITGNSDFCQGDSTTLTASGASSYAWSNSSTMESIIVSSAGNYTVTGTGANGCTNTATKTVTVNPTYTTPLTHSICQGETYNFYGQNLNVAGAYTHRLQTISGCDSVLILTLTVNALPIVTISGDTSICEGSSTTLTASGADTYNWNTGESIDSVSVSASGVYTVMGTSAAGCTNSANVTVLVLQAPQIAITGATDICAGESTLLTVSGGTTYLWSDGTTDTTLTVSTAGSWQVTGYSEAGCSSTASTTVSLWQPATSEFTVFCPDSCYVWNGEAYCESGEYTRTLQTTHGCDSVVTLHLTITVGINDHNLNNAMLVYPNPTSDVVNVQLTMNNEQSEGMSILVFDVYGRLLNVVETGRAPSLQTVQIDMSQYAQGVYFVNVVSEGKVVAVSKVVKR